MPNPTPEGRRYDPEKVFSAVRAALDVDLGRWTPGEPPPLPLQAS